MFLVVVVIDNLDKILIIDESMKSIEKESGKYYLKWKSTNKHIKIKYLNQLVRIKELRNAIFYGMYNDNKEYTRLTAFTIAKATLAKAKKNYSISIIIDALNDTERGIIRKELKKLKINYKKIKVLKDEQSAILRLADSIAGFLRDAVVDKQPYTRKYLSQIKKMKLIQEL